MCRKIIPYAYASSIYDIEIDFFKQKNIQYLLTDLDNTLDSYRQKLPSPKVFALKKNLLDSGIEMIIVSNNSSRRVFTYAKALGVRCFSSLRKPFAYKLNKLLKEAKINKNNVMMIGDQVVTDVLAANGVKIKVILTDKLVKEDQFTTHFNRLLDRPLRKYLKKKNLLKNWRELYE